MSITLYPGIPFSPQATLTNNIGAADTIIQVSDVSAFPPAPNLATIGTDEEGETVLYTAKTDTALSGCQRGVEGTAKAWAAGELIGRNFTAKDHADLITAVKEAAKTAEADGVAFQDGQTFQEKYDAGQLMGKDGAPGSNGADGKSAYQYAVDGGYTGTEEEFQALLGDALPAVSKLSSPNLLDNWYFPDPINQRGQTEYTESGYTIDRWIKTSPNSKLTIQNGFIRFLKTSAANAGGYPPLEQMIENPNRFAGLAVTLSVIYRMSSANTNAWIGITVNGTDNRKISAVSTSWTLDSYTFTCPAQISSMRVRAMQLIAGNDADTYVDILAVKLELGPRQTLAHQDENGSWVLNDPPPNKALELTKCQRYQYAADWGEGSYLVGVGRTVSTTASNIFIPIPTTLRTEPEVIQPDGAKWTITCNGNRYEDVTITKWAASANCILVRGKINSGEFPASNMPVLLAPNSGVKTIFDANL